MRNFVFVNLYLPNTKNEIFLKLHPYFILILIKVPFIEVKKI